MAEASPEATPQTNLFGSVGDITPPKNSHTLASPPLPNNNNGNPESSSSSQWFEEDDEMLLSTLLIGGDDDEGGDNNNNNLDQRLRRMRLRLQQDLSRATTKGGSGAAVDRWWNVITDTALSAGFSCASVSGGSNSNNSGDTTNTSSLPKSFNTPEGQLHLQAVMDLLGISKERAVKITLASLRSFASLDSAASTAAAGEESDKENKDDGKNNNAQNPGSRDSDLRSLLGTRDLFSLVLNRHRRQFIARLRVITECLRLEQEYKSSDNNDDDASNDDYEGVGKMCTALLDEIDASLVVNGNKRGLFQLLLGLATGPSLPGLGNGREMPYSVGKLTNGGNRSHFSNTIGPDESNFALRNEAAEALLMLLYDRIDNGVQRLDLFLLMEAAKCCPEFEFGMSALDYSRKGSSESGMATTLEEMQTRLNGIWSLLCSECMGLWRANTTSNGDWLRQHPFFADLDEKDGEIEGHTLSLRVGINDGYRKTQIELEALCQKVIELGEAVRERRRFVYGNQMKTNQYVADDGDELWGIQAPDAVTLLSFGLLLRLAHLASPSNEFLTKLGGWGRECAQMANDECAAFAYLHSVMESMVLDPLGQNGKQRRQVGIETMVDDLIKRGELQMMAGGSLVLTNGDEQEEGIEGFSGDAASIVYQSIGNEILSGTIRGFREELLSLKSQSAVDNICMLTNLASVLYCNSSILCDQFWCDWESFCNGDGMADADADANDDPICSLLDASHSLAVSTLLELNNGGPDKAIIHFLKPLSSFLRLITSLCANSSMVHSILDSDFLPEGLVAKSMSVCAALAPLISSLNDSDSHITAEECSTVRHATMVIQSISTLAFIGGSRTRDWIRQSLDHVSGPKVLCNIASQVAPRKHNPLVHDCFKLASSAMDLLAGLLTGADWSFQCDALTCFSPSTCFGADSSSAFGVLASGGMQSEVTLSVMLVLNCFAKNLTQNVFTSKNDTQRTVSSLLTIGNGIKVGLEVLSTLFAGGEVTLPSSDMQVGICHAIVSSVVATLIGLKPIIYLHEIDSVQETALSIRNEIINALATSTALGQVVASLSSAPISLAFMKNSTTFQELSLVMDSAVYQRQNVTESGKYGSWSRFVTPMRAKQKRAAKPADVSSNTDVISDTRSNIHDLSVTALSLLLLWGENAEDITRKHESPDESLLLQSPCNLLLCKASLPDSEASDNNFNVANLSLISRYASVDNVIIGDMKAKSALLSAKIIKMCLQHASASSGVYGDDARTGLSVFRAALGGGKLIFDALFDTFDKLINSSSLGTNEDAVVMAVIMLETIAISVDSHPELARSMLVGTEITQNWKLTDLIVAFVTKTVGVLRKVNENESVDGKSMNLSSFLTCGCLHVVSALWKSCRLVCTQNARSESKHACGVVTSHLAGVSEDSSPSLIANIAVELTRCSLLAIMSLQESEDDSEVSYDAISKKRTLVDLLTKALDIIAIEAVTRIQTKSHGGISFVEDLLEPEPMECWSILLASNNAAGLAASSWLFGFSASVEKSNALNWNVSSFLEAYPAEKNLATSTWCLFGQSRRLADSLGRPGSASTRKFLECNTLHLSIQAEDCFAASWAHFFEVVAAGCIKTKNHNEVYSLMNNLAECSLTALSSISEARMISDSILSSQGLSASSDTRPVGDLCSLLLYSLSVRNSFGASEDEGGKCDVLLGMFGRLYESANRLFAMTQLGSTVSSNQVAVCTIRQKLLSSALVIISEFEKLPGKRTRESAMKYNDIKIGLTNLAVNALQSLQYVQAGTDEIDSDDTTFTPSKFSYNFASMADNTDSAFQLLRTSLSLLLLLSPTDDKNNYLSNAYGVDFSSCFKQRSALQQILYHLSSASSVASLTYKAVLVGTSSQSVAMIHRNSVGIVNLIMTVLHTLTESGSSTVSVLLLLAESGCYRSLIGNTLLRATSVAWAPKSSSVDESASHIFTRHRGYNAPVQTSLKGAKPSSQKDLVHEIWLVVINMFASLLRSARQQSSTHEKVDEKIHNQLAPITKIVFDFVCTYERELFSCFASLFNEVHAQGSLSNKGGKTSFSSSIQSSSFAFTSNLLKECEAVSFLFAELCTGKTKVQFARSCGSIYKKILTASVELTKMTSSFLGSIGNARELFAALSDAKTMLDQPSAILDAHPLLVEGIPNARHEAIRNAHFAHSCCILATKEDFRDAHITTTQNAQDGESANNTRNNSASLEQSFQIHVNNKFIAEVERVAAYCLFNSLSVVANMHPASESFVSLSLETASQLDVAAVINPGAVVAICPQNTTAQTLTRYHMTQATARYARTIRCDRSTRSITVKYIKSGDTEQVPWSWLVGMEDTAKKHSLFTYLPAPKSIADADTRGQSSLGHLILALKWCRHFSSTSSMSKYCTPSFLVGSVAERVGILLCTEILLHDELHSDNTRLRDENARKINMQLLDLFGDGSESSSLSSVMNKDVLDSIKMQLKDQLHEASIEKEEERKMWEEQTSWDTSFLGGKKREGRRSPFRSLTRKTSSDFSS